MTILTFNKNIMHDPFGISRMCGLYLYGIEDLINLPKEEQEFIIRFGSFNCYRCRMKSYRAVVSLMKNKYRFDYGKIDNELRTVVRRFACKEILVHDSEPDYFICGDDNIPFKKDMLKKI